MLLLTIHDCGLVVAAAQERVLSGNLVIMLVSSRQQGIQDQKPFRFRETVQ